MRIVWDEFPVQCRKPRHSSEMTSGSREVAFGGSDPEDERCFLRGTGRCEVKHHFCLCSDNKKILDFGFVSSFSHLPPDFKLPLIVQQLLPSRLHMAASLNLHFCRGAAYKYPAESLLSKV